MNFNKFLIVSLEREREKSEKIIEINVKVLDGKIDILK